MTPQRSSDPRLRLRAPRPLFGALGLAVSALIALALGLLAAGGFVGFATDAAGALAIPAAFGAGVTGLSLRRPLSAGAPLRRGEIVTRSAFGYGVAGLVWPLSFALAILAQGDPAGALAHLPPALAGTLIGAAGGGLGGIGASFLAFARV